MFILIESVNVHNAKYQSLQKIGLPLVRMRFPEAAGETEAKKSTYSENSARTKNSLFARVFRRKSDKEKERDPGGQESQSPHANTATGAGSGGLDGPGAVDVDVDDVDVGVDASGSEAAGQDEQDGFPRPLSLAETVA